MVIFQVVVKAKEKQLTNLFGNINHNLIKEWSSCEEASKYYKISSGALNQALKGKVKISKNSIWKYLNYQNPWGLQKS